MHDLNFIPCYRVAARQRRSRLNGWIAGGTVYATALVVAYVACHTLWGGGQDVLAGQRGKTDARIQATGRAIRTAQDDLAAQERMLKAVQAVTKHPDWSLLLAVLPGSLNGEVFLTRCDVRPVMPAMPTVPAGPPRATRPGAATAAGPAAATGAGTSGLLPAPAPPQPKTVVVRMAGYGRTMEAVLQLAQELERLGLFEQVRLIKTNSEPYRKGTAVNFQIECTLSGKPGAAG